MKEKLRKTKTSTEVKRRYNEKTYTQISFSVSKETAAQFKEKCRQKGVSQAQIFKMAIESFLQAE